ncbi:MAG: phosphoglycerate dehydrogenase, partial [Armatimonadetes bacterium]|nr:phosphoglycerate dehydrogenase [Armatimonadota bacterium]
MKILITDPIPEEGRRILSNAFQVEYVPGLSEEELRRKIAHADALVVRSETKVTARVLEGAESLKIIGRAGVGTDNIDVDFATRKGILVVNSPEGNTISASEHTMGLLLALARNIPQAHVSLHGKSWKRSQFVGVELYNKVLGVVGLGKIGREVVRRARSFQMQIIGHDPYLTPEQVEELGIEMSGLDDLCAKADFITLHVPLTRETEKIIGPRQFTLMRPEARIVNCARGGIIDEDALHEALLGKKIAGAALDVFSQEPPFSSPLLDLEEVVVTPHLGASTEEAQLKVAVAVAEQIVDFLSGKPARSPVNLPAFRPEVLGEAAPYLGLAERMGSLLAQLAEGPIQSVGLTLFGELAEISAPGEVVLSTVILKGLLSHELGDGVNYVNAAHLARTRGIQVVEGRSHKAAESSNLFLVRVKTPTGEWTCGGSLPRGSRKGRIVQLNDFRVDLVP